MKSSTSLACCSCLSQEKAAARSSYVTPVGKLWIRAAPLTCAPATTLP